MTHPIRNRSRLLVGCGSAALALALALAPKTASAQAINASGNVVSGSASIEATSPGQTTVDVASPTAVIDWTPIEDGNGDALVFLPTNTTALFQSGQQPNFAVLNRILPSTNGNIAVIDGTVLSRVNDAQGLPTAGGFVAFYSPTGFLIGDNAVFDVGQLMLTTLDTSAASFDLFATQGFGLQLQGAPGSTARIQINPGAQINALAENSFFAVVAADVQMLGTARVNGSHAYVAGEVVNLSFSNGLFDISVPVGTAATGTVMELDGNIGGPASSAGTDYHMIYGVGAAQADPISMIFRGNLGFDPAQTAGVINGEIILSANYNVTGLNINGANIRSGTQADFRNVFAVSDVRADILVEDVTATGRLLALSTHLTRVSAVNADSSFADDLIIVGRQNAELIASNAVSMTIDGNVLVSAQDYGVVGSSFQSLDLINAQGGAALLSVSGGATMNITGSANVTADAFAGAEGITGIAGTAQGGQAQVIVTGGTLNIDNSVSISARGVGTTLNNVLTGATSRGGLAEFRADQGANVTLGFFLGLEATATGARGSLFGPSTVSDAFGGNALVNVSGGSSLTVGASITADASATGGRSNTAGAGSVGDAGQASVTVDGASQIDVVEAIQLTADGFGGQNVGGIGGTGLGGRASAVTLAGGSGIDIGGNLRASTFGAGGNGQTGGDAFGGIAGANAVLGNIVIGQDGFAFASAEAGGANAGFGGNGGIGRGGNAFFQADGTLTTLASLTIGGNATLDVQGYGGFGGNGDGNLVAAGRGGDGYGGQFTVPNQADPTRGSGAYLLAGGDNGTLSVGGLASVFANGFGGFGGFGGSAQNGGRGGDAFGGLAQVGLALLGQDGSLGEGSASYTSLVAEANAFGGSGGFSFGDEPTGDGGNATGGNALLTVRAGTVTADTISLNALASGGGGVNGGFGNGGIAAVLGSLGGSLTASQLSISADGDGGFGGNEFLGTGTGGNGQGGQAELDLSGITVQINGDVEVRAEGFGGGTGDFTAGNGTGGNARLGVLGTAAGSGTITGNTIISANGFGGSSGALTGGISGDGFGGFAVLQAQAGGTVSLATLQMMANGFGGEGEGAPFAGGDGTGGTSTMTATGTGSQITIASNVTNQLLDNFNFGAIISATGVGGAANSAPGLGGTGRGGTAQLTAAAGGSIALPATPQTDPDTVGFIRLFARGFGGNTNIDGGTGGDSYGGLVAIDVDGGNFSMGETVLSSFTQGGTAEVGVINVTGGNAFAGGRRVSIRNGGTATLTLIGGGAGAQGGNGTGTGNGGNAYVGQNLFEIINSSATIIGNLPIFDQSQGGDGRQGGNVFNVNPQTGVAGSLNIVLDNADITLTPDASGESGIGIDFVTRGGNGVVRGGNAQGPNVLVTVNQTDLSGGFLNVNPVILGGNASDINGIGGDALGSLIDITISNSQLALQAQRRSFTDPVTGSPVFVPGDIIFASDATGGNGGANGSGGSAVSGQVDVSLINSAITVTSDATGTPADFIVRSGATAGQGGTMGNATSARALLDVTDSTLAAARVAVEARASASPVGPGQLGGIAAGGQARLGMAGTSAITTDLVDVDSSAVTGQGGSATGGFALLEVLTGGAAIITAPAVNVLADASSTADNAAGIAGATQGGQATVAANGGSLTITGNVFANARGIGAVSANLFTGATSRGGQAQVLARNGGNLAFGSGLSVDASAVGANITIANTGSVSDAFGGSAGILVAEGGGTITVTGTARANASARGGTANTTGAGSIGDAGDAIVSILEAGLIDIGGRLTLEAQGAGGSNGDGQSGIGGTGLGGRAIAIVQNGGTLRLDSLDADTLGTGGNGLTGGDGFGGLANVAVRVGQIRITGRAFAGSEGVGGDSTFGRGGNGGLGQGGFSGLQAIGTLTEVGELFIGGDAIAFAQGVGGRGGAGDGDAGIAGGNGGNGIGGQFTVPNQADPNVPRSGAYIIAGGDNGLITVVGDSVAVATGVGGRGGAAAGTLPGGRGGDALGGLASVGLELALLGLNGSVGLGRMQLGDVLIQSDAFAGEGGFATNPALAGIGGNAAGGGSLLLLSAGEVNAAAVEVTAIGFGGNGGTGGNGTGGFAGVNGTLAGAANLAQLSVLANGFGGNSVGTGAGGIGEGGDATLTLSGYGMTVTGDLLVEASGFGGTANNAVGGAGIGGFARIGEQGTEPASLIVGGHAGVLANGQGGNTSGAFAAGNGTGGDAFIEARDGNTITLGSAQAAAVGRGGAASVHEGGDGTGGTVRLGALGANSRLTIQRNVPDAVAANAFAGGVMFNANGIGEATRGGDGIGGTARGGTLEVTATQGGTIALPTDLASDPNSSATSLFLFARAFAGGSAVDGGTGGDAFGGDATILADGGTITMGPATLSPFAQGGNSLSPTSNISGGNVFGGNRTIRVINGGTLTMQSVGGGPGGIAGNGSGSGNGGSVTTGNNLFEVIGSTANLVGDFAVFNQSQGGNGETGGEAEGGTLTFNAENATINLLADANGNASLSFSGGMQGGNGISSGGNATGTSTNISIVNSTISGGRFEVSSAAIGGSASAIDGVGGNATGGPVTINITGSQLNLQGQTLFAADARGGAGGTGGSGGSAIGGTVEATLTGSTVTIIADSTGNPGELRVRSQGTGGAGETVGSGTGGRAALTLDGTTLTAAQVGVEANGFANAISTGQTGGIAVGGQASLSIAGNTQVTTSLIEIASNALSSPGGSTFAGVSSLEAAAGSTATVNAGAINLQAFGVGANQTSLANLAGQFVIDIAGGNINAGSLFAGAVGDQVNIDLGDSRIVADGGNLNVANALTATTLGDLLIRSGNGGIIGSPATTGTLTAIDIDATGTIEVVGDGTNGGLGGRSIDMLAGRSILLGGNLTTSGGNITLTANHGNAPVLATPTVSVFSMAPGARINAGTGTVAISLLDGAGNPQQVNGGITLANITGGAIDVRNFGTATGSDITVLSGGVLSASGTGRAIDLAALNGEVVNLAGDAGLILTGGGHYAIFAATPTGSQIGSFANYARRYNVGTDVAYDALNPGGNFAAFRIAPVLAVTVNDATRVYGNANPQFTTSFGGFLPGDGITNLSGTAEFITLANGTSGIGVFTVNAALGSLLSEQGYQFTFAPGLLTITPRPITVTANDLSRIYGNANPSLTFTVGGLGLVNGDQLTGAIATTAGVTTGVGAVPITQGTLAASANYTLTFVGGQLAITPRPIIVTANDLSRIYGDANPSLTFTVGGLGLVNGDQLTGAIATTAGVATGVGAVPITQGTLAASPNYTLTFVGGQLAITPRPLSLIANSFTRLFGLPDPEFTFVISGDGLVNGDRLTGALVRDPGENIGNYAIRQGTLTAGDNYAIDFANGQLTIDPPPAPPVLANSTLIDEPLQTGEDPPVAAEEEEERFGMDFPEQPDAPLISEDPLLDDPVTSGGDASLYSGGGTGNPGSEDK